MIPFVSFNTYNPNYPFGSLDAVLNPLTHHHLGSDFIMRTGRPIIAPRDGQVIQTRFDAARGFTAVFDFIYDGEWGLELCHLLKLATLGNFQRGDVIAYSGNSGSATTGPHLHVVMHKNAEVTKDYAQLTSPAAYERLIAQGQIVNPYEWFKKRLSTFTSGAIA